MRTGRAALESTTRTCPTAISEPITRNGFAIVVEYHWFKAK
jgi:hypothetical protein